MNRIIPALDYLYQRHPIIFGALLAFLIIGMSNLADIVAPPP